jgi:ABC-2 type transport system permease protein
MSTLVGTRRLVRLILRRDRVRLTIWVVLLSLFPIYTASALIQFYPDEAARQALARGVAANPAFTALLGPLYDTTYGALLAWRIGTFSSLFVALMAVLTMIRHTREEEETGRRELLGSTVLGRHAPLAAATIVVIGAALVIGVFLTVGLVGLDLPLTGSLAYGFGTALVALAFAGVGAVSAQLTENASTGRGVGVGIIGFFFLLRMAGDAGEANGVGWLTWLSPIGWFTKLRPYAEEQWWVVVLWAALAIGGLVLAFAISARRDVGAGAFPPRPGPAIAAPSLGSPFGLAWRLQRGAFIGWAAGIGTLAVVYGAVGNSIGDILETSPQVAEILQQIGGVQGLTDAYFASTTGIISIVVCAYAIRSVIRLRVEEEGMRAEHVLATATPRGRWAWSHLVFGVAGPVVILLLAGLLMGLGYGMVAGDFGQTPRILAAAMVNLPAVWILAGATMALYGLAPNWTGVSWGLLVAFLLLGQLGALLKLPQWALDLSPFTHIPMVPAEDLDPVPIAMLLAVGVGLIAAGLAGFRRRDVDF